MLKEARDDARLGNSSNDLQFAAAPRAPAQVDGKYPVQSVMVVVSIAAAVITLIVLIKFQDCVWRPVMKYVNGQR